MPAIAPDWAIQTSGRRTNARASCFSEKANHSINYSVRDHVVARDETVLGKRVRHESYSLPRDQAARFDLIEAAGHRLIVLRLTHEAGTSHTDPPRPLEVVASLGKHRARQHPRPEEGQP